MHSNPEAAQQVEIAVEGVSMLFGKKGHEVAALNDVHFEVMRK